ncbi:hypothetical protein EI983_00870 [Roseovarius faecimaris]|uniref:Uncharacterized protein n=1 Tax=Roseovarius faecimaris TaxID=2494550 RepID=A0A6I6IN44_9RHOB|nr:hypothetical protein [Roseovarius faecimaris]QGX96907.1 hypothetical protein EI983_00870 [Roseovarius faecimaris]
MYLKALFTCLTLIMATLSGASLAQQSPPTRTELIEFIGQIPELKGTREAMAQLGYKSPQLDLVVDHEQRLWNDKVIAGYVADRLIGLYNGNLPNGWAPEGLIAPLFDSGYTNLSRSDKIFYFKVQSAILNAMSVNECGLIIKGRMSERRLERTISRAEARLSADTLKRYYQLQRTAIRTGVSKAPKTLSPADSARIQEKLNAAVRSRIESDPNLKGVAAAMENMNRASTTNACQTGLLYYDTALSMKGRDLDHVLLYMNE